MTLRSCVVCKTNEYANHYCQIDGYDYLHCKQCGLIYVDQLEKTENIYKAYSGGMLKSLRRRLMAPYRQFHHVRDFEYSVNRAAKIFNHAEQASNTRPGKYLDIGCNKGFLLAQGIEKGWDVYGCELVPELTVPFGNTFKEHRDHIFQGRFVDIRPKFSNETFDLITAIDVIEHFEDVVADLTSIYEILKPNGVFVIQTPDILCAESIQTKGEWGALKPLEHLHLFSLENLRTLAARVGFSSVVGYDEAFEESCGNFCAVLRK